MVAATTLRIYRTTNSFFKQIDSLINKIYRCKLDLYNIARTQRGCNCTFLYHGWKSPRVKDWREFISSLTGYNFATYFFTSVISILYTEQHACHNVELLCSTKGIQNITYFLFYSWRIIFIVILLKVATYSWNDLIWKDRLQNSPYFCLFKYARPVQRKVWNEAENRERDWGETLKIRTVRFAYVNFVRITRFSQPRAIPIG